MMSTHIPDIPTDPESFSTEWMMTIYPLSSVLDFDEDLEEQGVCVRLGATGPLWGGPLVGML